MTTIAYQICPKNPETHLFEVRCIIPTPNPKGQKIQFPAWIPGSYLIRDFVKFVETIEAYEAKEPYEPNRDPANSAPMASGLKNKVALKMLDKHTWLAEPVKGPLVISYRVFAFDLTPRGAHLDTKHAFFNGSRMFIQVDGFEECPCELEILPPASEQYNHWRVATTFPVVKINAKGFGHYRAENYDQFIDFPVEMGDFTKLEFNVLGIPHELIITGQHFGDLPRLCRDLKILCETILKFFGEPYPIDRYQFLLTLIKSGYGGLEHSYSTCLQLSPNNLPSPNDENIVTDNYRTLLGLFSHEYFHLWNVKRIRPNAFCPYNLSTENYTRMLWVFEGITSYYDELFLVRSGLISLESYLELLGQLITRVYETPGRFKQTLEQSSFEAWSKFYQPTENSINSTISYYAKGALIALALDLLVRRDSAGRFSLDDIMQKFWEKYGAVGKPVPEDGFEKLAAEVTGLNLEDFFNQALRGTEDIDIESLLTTVGIEAHWQLRASMDELGGKPSLYGQEILTHRSILEIKLKGIAGNAEILTVLSGGAAEEAGLSVQDIIIAVNHLRVDRNSLESTIANYPPGTEVILHIFRREELISLKVKLRAGWLRNCILQRKPDPTPTQNIQCADWIKNINKENDLETSSHVKRETLETVTRKTMTKPETTGGFTFVEVLASLLLMSIGMIMAIMLTIKSKSTLHNADWQTNINNIHFSMQEALYAHNDANPTEYWNSKLNEHFKGSQIEISCNNKTCSVNFLPPHNAFSLHEKKVLLN